MKLTLFTLALALGSALPAHADSIWLTGAKAEAIVQPLIDAGADPIETHEYFHSGVMACAKLFDDKGDYFDHGAVGDYVGEECMFYGDAEDADNDGQSHRQILIPRDDRNLEHSDDLRTRLSNLRAMREGLEAIVLPITRTVHQGTRDIVIAQTSGIGGIACDGHNPQGQRVCQVLLSPKCPARK